jgi:hypothetical protein
MPFVDIERVDLALSEQEKQECIRLGKEQAAPLLRVLDPNKLFARRFAAAKAARERNSVSIGTQTVEVNETASTRGRNNKRKASEEVAQGRENKALKLSKYDAPPRSRCCVGLRLTEPPGTTLSALRERRISS